MDAGSADTFEELYRKNYKNLVRSACSKLRDMESAEDIVQDVFAAAYQKKEVLLSSPNPVGWLYLTLQNKIKHEIRSRLRFAAMLDEMGKLGMAEQSSDKEFWDGLFEVLSLDEYKMLKMIYVEGYSNLEVAEELGISYAACRKRVQKAKNKIREKHTL